MRKATAIISALVLALACSFSAMAANGSATVEKGSANVDVQAKYESSVTTPEVYSVDIAWGEMEFTYSASGSLQWDASTHQYTENVSATWSGKGNTVTVTNHSNAEVDVALSYASLGEYAAVNGSFDVETDTLNAGVVGDAEGADKVVSTLTLDGELAETVTEFTKIGTITVTIQ